MSSGARVAGVAICLLMAIARATPAGDETRLERADALLSAPEGYAQAIRLYRELLAEQPSAREVRRRLARVLSWRRSFDESLTEYDRLLADNSADLGARVERAELISWKGDYQAAEAEFAAILQTDPANARAARGLARVYRWWGRPAAADPAYARALELEADPEAQAEWDELRSPYRPLIRLLSEGFGDTDEFKLAALRVEARVFADLETLLRASLGVVRASHPQQRVPVPVRSSHDRDLATELALGVERELTLRLKGIAEAGLRAWSHAADRPFGRARLEFEWTPGTSLGLEIESADFVDMVQSFEALQRDIRYTHGGFSMWRSLTPLLEAWWRVDLARLTDGNTRSAADGSLSYRPWSDRPLLLHMRANALSYSDRSLAYYDPELDLGWEVALEHALSLGAGVELEYAGGIGLARSRDLAGSESGAIWSLEGALSWQRGLWSASLRGTLHFSQRSSRYGSRQGRLVIERKL